MNRHVPFVVMLLLVGGCTSNVNAVKPAATEQSVRAQIEQLNAHPVVECPNDHPMRLYGIGRTFYNQRNYERAEYYLDRVVEELDQCE